MIKEANSEAIQEKIHTLQEQIRIMRKEARNERIRFFIVCTLIVVCVFGIGTYLWNLTLPHLFNIPEINFFQFVALFILFRFITYGDCYTSSECLICDRSTKDTICLFCKEKINGVN